MPTEHYHATARLLGRWTDALSRGPLQAFVLQRLEVRQRLSSTHRKAIEFTRFPSCPNGDGHEGRLLQAADLIGQLGDPVYLKKANALFYEFEEVGMNRQLGYFTPADLVERYPDFYRAHVSSHLEDAISYLNVTANGRQWVANLHSHVFCAEHSFSLMGPQR